MSTGDPEAADPPRPSPVPRDDPPSGADGASEDATADIEERQGGTRDDDAEAGRDPADAPPS
jgi:hypothetical protein